MGAFDRWLLRTAERLLGSAYVASQAIAKHRQGVTIPEQFARPYELPTALTDRARMFMPDVPNRHRGARAERMGADTLMAEAVFGIDNTDEIADYIDAAYGAPFAVSGAEFIPATIQN